MKILLLGGTGAIGNALCLYLDDGNNDISITTRTRRCSESPNIKYIQGNAHDIDFLKRVLDKRYDVIIDFMVYETSEFKKRVEYFLQNTKQYIFISSSRVYADAQGNIDENTERLLDVIKDKRYLKTDEYALTKARQENELINSGYKNWTIVRPYITYNDNRLQLGFFEKEYWLRRYLEGKKIVFFEDLGEKRTTFTYGEDVALGITKIIGNDLAYGECLNITTKETATWNEILDIYVDILQHISEKKLQIKRVKTVKGKTTILGVDYQYYYDRAYNRIFNLEKLRRVSGGQIEHTELKEGLKKCLTKFMEKPEFAKIDYLREGYLDYLAGDRTSLSKIVGKKDKVRYMLSRYMPIVVLGIKKIRR